MGTDFSVFGHIVSDLEMSKSAATYPFHVSYGQWCSIRLCLNGSIYRMGEPSLQIQSVLVNELGPLCGEPTLQEFASVERLLFLEQKSIADKWKTTDSLAVRSGRSQGQSCCLALGIKHSTHGSGNGMASLLVK